MERLIDKVKVGSVIMVLRTYVCRGRATQALGDKDTSIFGVEYWEVVHFKVSETCVGTKRPRVLAHCKCLYNSYRTEKIGTFNNWSLDPTVDWRLVKF